MNSSIIVRTACVALVFMIAACASDPKDGPPKPGQQRTAAQERVEAEKLYRSAREVLDNGDMSTALQRYDKLSQQFPFSEYSTQGELERVYALYRNYQPDQALAAADKFIREHPRHPGAAYAQYLKGLINSTRDEGLSGYIGLDTTKEDVGFLRNAFDDFAVLVRKYPTSPYVGDARQRMIDLRNRVAQHEMHIVRFYVKRGAYIAAAKRAELVVTQYPGAPASLEALKLLQESYRALKLTQQADDAGKLLAALSKSQATNDYPDYTPNALPKSLKEHTPVQVVPVDDVSQVQDDSWLQNLLSVFSSGSKESTQSVAANQTAPAQTPASTAPAAEEDNGPDNPNLADVLKATLGQKTSRPKPSGNAPLTTEGKAKQTNTNTPVQVVPVGKDGETQPAESAAPAAPQDDSWFGKFTGLFGVVHSSEDLAPGGRAKVSKTPLIKDTPPPPALAAPTAQAPTAQAPAKAAPANDSTPIGIASPSPAAEVEVPSTSEDDSWFGKLARFFGATSSSGTLATGGRPQPSKEPLIKDTPPPAAAAPVAAPAPIKPNTTVKKIPAQAAEKKEGNWFTRLFSIFDTSESEPYTVVIPTGSAAPKTPAPAKATPASAPAAKSADPTVDDVLADKPAAKPAAPAEPEKPKNKITIEMEPYDDAPAKPAEGSTPPKSQ